MKQSLHIDVGGGILGMGSPGGKNINIAETPEKPARTNPHLTLPISPVPPRQLADFVSRGSPRSLANQSSTFNFPRSPNAKSSYFNFKASTVRLADLVPKEYNS